MLLANMSTLGFVNYFGLNYPWVKMTPEFDYEYEHVLVPFIGFNEFDFEEVAGNIILRSPFDIKLKGRTLQFVKSNEETSNQILFLYSFPVIEGGVFGAFEGSKTPEKVFKFSSGNPDQGYFNEMMFLLQKDIYYEVLYHSELLNKVVKIEMFWDFTKNEVCVYSDPIL
jgi:hypothetical protein